MSGPEMWSPQAAGEGIRSEAWPNRAVEVASIREADRRAFEKYSEWENGLHQEVTRQHDEQTELLEECAELFDDITRDVISPLDGGAPPDRNTAFSSSV